MTEQNQNQLSTLTQVSESESYVVLQDQDGKFVRKAKFNDYSSIVAETREDKVWLLNLLEGNEETGNGLKDHVGKQITVANVITRKYDKINEETGQTEYGVLTYLITPDKVAYVTSSKSVYFSIIRIMDLFGKPTDAEWQDIVIQVTKKKMQNGDSIQIKLIG